jgi:DNA-binding response OmpR family regulator
MPPIGSVLVIEDDESVSGLLAQGIREAGYDVHVCATAKVGFEAAVRLQPDCIVCDVDLPDESGHQVAQSVRTHPSRLSLTPFLFLASDDAAARIEGFQVGADVLLTKPVQVDEAVAQVAALVQMAARLRARGDSLIPLESAAFEGDVGQMAIGTVLTLLELERRTGVVEVVSRKRRARLEIQGGAAAHGLVGGTRVSALTALRTMLGWTVGRFAFTPSPSREQPPGARPLGALLLEATRLQDEAARKDLELPPSRRRPAEPRLAAPVLGGPGSSPADFAPASSRTPEFVRPSERDRLSEAEPTAWEIPPSQPLRR